MGKTRRAIGLMSGTSMDGIDVALIETDGEAAVRRLGSATYAYDEALRGRLRQVLAEAAKLWRQVAPMPAGEVRARQALISGLALSDRQARPGLMGEVEREITERHAEAVRRFIGDRMLQPSAIDVVGFHGQTVLHRPELQLTVQIGDGPLLARSLGIDVVYDLRAADVLAGGQGAPLVPVYHRALAGRLAERPVAFLNIGGVANVTWIGAAEGELIAFDTGPGNALLDDWALRHTGEAVDRGGVLAASGRVNDDALTALLLHPYFGQVPPKSLDRNAFSIAPVEGLSPADGAATLAAFTAASIARARAHMPEEPQLWVVMGGGRRNTTLMSEIAARVEAAVVPAEAIGLDGDGIEAEAWAYLAVRALDDKAITYPRTTGVAAPMSGGVLVRAFP